MIVTIEDPQVGRTRQMGIPVTLVENPGRIKGPAPRLGEHNHSVVRELGYSDEALRNFMSRGVI
jgi:crotonobetainyl-CoA:carnitine CoA-transferase CaiB-like acyl-CoA transferase